MKTTRCKMMCTNVGMTNHGHGNTCDYTFTPMYDDKCEENKAFWDATPSGKLEISCSGEHDFVAGKYYYIDISLA